MAPKKGAPAKGKAEETAAAKAKEKTTKGKEVEGEEEEEGEEVGEEEEVKPRGKGAGRGRGRGPKATGGAMKRKATAPPDDDEEEKEAEVPLTAKSTPGAPATTANAPASKKKGSSRWNKGEINGQASHSLTPCHIPSHSFTLPHTRLWLPVLALLSVLKGLGASKFPWSTLAWDSVVQQAAKASPSITRWTGQQAKSKFHNGLVVKRKATGSAEPSEQVRMARELHKAAEGASQAFTSMDLTDSGDELVYAEEDEGFSDDEDTSPAEDFTEETE
jgi:hypothetical protein